MASNRDATDGADAVLHAGPGFLGWVSVLVHRHRDRLLAYARRRGLDAEDALDAVQDSFISFLSLPEARAIAPQGDDSLKFLTVLLRHNVLNYTRKRGRRQRAQIQALAEAALVQHDSSETLIARAEELARAYGCIKRMERLQREVIMLSLLDEMPRGEVARVLGISDGYVRVLLHRAREHVRSCPAAFEEVEPEAA